jgi:tetratricopeptide (TPR) repeat protein
MPRVHFLRFAVLFLAVPLTLRWGIARAEQPFTFPQDARNRFDQARDLQNKGDYQEAIKAFDDAIKLGMQSYPRAHLYQANSYLSLKDYDAAIARYTKFIGDFGIEESCRY